ncbi:MAG: electron transport complex subunit RsxA [Bacillota bacterium]|nr:electron transport complex subunit RsxA [Bacillota bacterium]
MKELLLLIAGSILVNNFVLSRFLGICPFLGVSQRLDTALSMGAATTFVLTMAGAATWAVQSYLLVPWGLGFLQTLAFIIIIAALVQLVEMIILKTNPVLYRALGIFLPLITTNCAVLGLAILAAGKGYNLVETSVFGFGVGLGFTLALVMMAGIRSNLEYADIPAPLRGAPIALITAGLLSLAFTGFSGLISM